MKLDSITFTDEVKYNSYSIACFKSSSSTSPTHVIKKINITKVYDGHTTHFNTEISVKSLNNKLNIFSPISARSPLQNGCTIYFWLNLYSTTVECHIFFQKLSFTERQCIFSHWLFQPWRFTSYWMWQTDLKYDPSTKYLFNVFCKSLYSTLISKFTLFAICFGIISGWEGYNRYPH